MTGTDLQEQLTAAAEELGVPGAAAGISHAGSRREAFVGVTSVENPLPVDEQTLFQIGSAAKTFTATALMRLVEAGRVDLARPVRAYVPELRLQDERAADDVTVLHLLNHTAGWDGDFVLDTGEGDDALERFVESLADLTQGFPVGAAASYNNVSFVLAGRVVEKVTGLPFERALEELVLAPLGLTHTLTSLESIMTRRFSVGHTCADNGSAQVHRPWSDPRAEVPLGGRIVSTVSDLLRWADVHLHDGRTRDGVPLLSASTVRRMQESSTEHEVMPGVGVGIAWLLREIEGVRVVEHPGDVTGQQAAFTMVPERDWAVTVLANSSPNGQELKNRIVAWALEHDLGLVQRDPEPIALDAGQLAEYLGAYAAEGISMHVTPEGSGLVVAVRIGDDGAGPADEVPIGMLDRERFVVVGGPFKGHQGHFVRGAGEINALALAGRVVPRVGDEEGAR